MSVTYIQVFLKITRSFVLSKLVEKNSIESPPPPQRTDPESESAGTIYLGKITAA